VIFSIALQKWTLKSSFKRGTLWRAVVRWCRHGRVGQSAAKPRRPTDEEKHRRLKPALQRWAFVATTFSNPESFTALGEANMLRTYWKSLFLGYLGAIALVLSGVCQFTPAAEGDESVVEAKSSVSKVPEESTKAVSPAMARDRARTMYRIYASTLDVLHDHYFHINRAVLPARAMEDIFSDVAGQSGVKTRWIAVNAKAMSVDHEPADDFEKEAAQRIAAGEKEVEQLKPDMYRYVGSIPLHENCVQCHMGTFSNPPKKPRFAGLVISIPTVGE